MPEGKYTVDLSTLRTVREGRNVTVFCYGAMVPVCQKAADKAAEKGIETLIVDLRTLLPLDEDGVLDAAKQTGRVVVVHEAPRFCGFGAEISALIAENVHRVHGSADRARRPASTRRSRTRSSTTTCPTTGACSMRSSTTFTLLITRTAEMQRSRDMALEFKLPDIGEGIAEGEIVKWLVKVGDTVKEHQSIVEVMTDKATVEVPSPAAGKITAIKAKEGDTVPVGSVIFVLETRGRERAAAPRPHRPAPQRHRRGPNRREPATRRAAQPLRRARRLRSLAHAVAAPSGARRSSSSCPTSAKASPRARSSSGSSRPATSVKEHQSIVEVMTDKATVEVPAPAAGTITAAHAPRKARSCRWAR